MIGFKKKVVVNDSLLKKAGFLNEIKKKYALDHWWWIILVMLMIPGVAIMILLILGG